MFYNHFIELTSDVDIAEAARLDYEWFRKTNDTQLPFSCLHYLVQRAFSHKNAMTFYLFLKLPPNVPLDPNDPALSDLHTHIVSAIPEAQDENGTKQNGYDDSFTVEELANILQERRQTYAQSLTQAEQMVLLEMTKRERQAAKEASRKRKAAALQTAAQNVVPIIIPPKKLKPLAQVAAEEAAKKAKALQAAAEAAKKAERERKKAAAKAAKAAKAAAKAAKAAADLNNKNAAEAPAAGANGSTTTTETNKLRRRRNRTTNSTNSTKPTGGATNPDLKSKTDLRAVIPPEMNPSKRLRAKIQASKRRRKKKLAVKPLDPMI